MVDAGASLTILAIALQSLGKVLYGTFLGDVSTPWFILVSISLTAAVFLASVGFRMPREGRGLLALANIWTAITFISLFFALKHLPPAMFASIEIGAALLTAIVFTSVQKMAWPPLLRVLACVGILAGCALLTRAEIVASLSEPDGDGLIWIAVAAAMATGVTSALSATTCRKLAINGWTSCTVLAHRFYLTIAVAAAWLVLETPDIAAPGLTAISVTAIVGSVGVLLPLLLLQVALRRVDELTVMICMAAQPILSFLISVPSPAYDWNLATLIGVVIVTLFVGLDIVTQRPMPKLSAVRDSMRDAGRHLVLRR